MRQLALVAWTALALFAFACGGDENGDTEGAATTTPPASDTVAASGTPAATITAGLPIPPAAIPAQDEVEVTGIVGSVNTDTRVIEITRVSGADVSRIGAPLEAAIQSARGGDLTLEELRPSDRITARGILDGDTLVASSITVLAAAPGAAPGG